MNNTGTNNLGNSYNGEDEVRNVRNAIYILVYFFLYGLTLFIPGKGVIIATTIVLVCLSLFNNRNNLKIRFATILFFFCMCIAILIKLLFFGAKETDIYYSIDFLTIGSSGILLGSFPFSLKAFIKYGRIIAFLNFAILVWAPLYNLYNSGYMGFGYAMIPTVIMLLISLDKTEKKWKTIVCIVVMIIATAEIIVYGARGCILVIIAMGVFYFLLVIKKHLLLKISIVGIVILLFFNIRYLLYVLTQFLESKNISSYSILKINVALESGLKASSSGRGELYSYAINMIKENPIFGSGLSSAQTYRSGLITYYHNIFLQIGCDFGIFVLLIFVVYVFYTLVKVCKTKQSEPKLVYFSIFSVCFGRLMVSSTYWARPEFWLFMGICLCGFIWKEREQNE